MSDDGNDAIFSSYSEENMYIWERPEWPRLTWDEGRLLELLAAARMKQGRLLGGMARLGFDELVPRLAEKARSAIGGNRHAPPRP